MKVSWQGSLGDTASKGQPFDKTEKSRKKRRKGSKVKEDQDQNSIQRNLDPHLLWLWPYCLIVLFIVLFPSLFSFSMGWNADVMTVAGAATLDHEMNDAV